MWTQFQVEKKMDCKNIYRSFSYLRLGYSRSNYMAIIFVVEEFTNMEETILCWKDNAREINIFIWKVLRNGNR